MSKLDEKEAEQVLKTTHCWEQILQQGQTDPQNVSEPRRAKQPTSHQKGKTRVSQSQGIEQPSQQSTTVHRNGRNHRYRSTVHRLLEALHSVDIYFKSIQQRTQRQLERDIDTLQQSAEDTLQMIGRIRENTKPGPILTDKTATDTIEPASTNLRSVLKNKDAVQKETIRRSL